ncbi:hypothetical protein QPM17_22030 [Marinobacter sp. TBZ242]|uniref:Uncharacterized protein n=1 Tax=Marinobacter azerbaijanicus TaxID=3050455 RepID=A0ABT7II20_9GAMM|nr:hypothetical protein [Marinobacter sp. TBZ242]MDL0433824.1 hypothetical protein [Marinobacter sp. TBZ242]
MIKQRNKKKKSEVERLLSQLSSLKKNLPNCKSEESRLRSMLKIYEVERKLKLAKGNVKSGLAGRGVSIVQGGSPGLGKR